MHSVLRRETYIGTECVFVDGGGGRGKQLAQPSCFLQCTHCSASCLHTCTFHYASYHSDGTQIESERR